MFKILSYLRNYWANRPECQRVVLNSVFGAALPAEHNALTLRSIAPNTLFFFRYDKIRFKTLFLQIWETVFGAALPAEFQRVWHSGRLAEYSFWDMQNV